MDIDSMQAGPEMDRMIAEKVMGWKRWRESKVNWIHPTGYGTSNVPNFSTDIAAAWEVFNHVRINWLFSVRKAFFAHLREIVSKEHVILKGNLISWPDVFIFVQPVHFCKAALKAVEGK